jgi:hypothetical protein
MPQTARGCVPLWKKLYEGGESGSAAARKARQVLRLSRRKT